MIEELREKIEGILNTTIYGWGQEHKLIKNDVLDQILTLIKEAGYVKLAEDQSLPDRYDGGQQEMFKQGWRKVEQEKELC